MQNMILAVMYSDKGLYNKVKSILIGRFGDIKAESSEYDFDRFTHFYEKEMGKNLVKRFLAFNRDITKQELVGIKKQTTDIEKEFSEEGKRRINLDPGYVNERELVLASFKTGTNYKEELGEGVYAHRVLEFKDGKTVMFWHTFPDYRVKENQGFFIEK
ncbi:DUF4416 family protein [Candidatus Woesearchaeota archaeon]|nr:DUF4416 family protein [Candidatus Woesearchaeota archaeon]